MIARARQLELVSKQCSEEMAAKRVQLFYDVLSPYSWIAFEILSRYRSRWNILLEYCPFLLSGVMREAENRPPGFVAAKARYMQENDIPRLSQYFQIPIKPPENVAEVMFQNGSLKAQRLLIAAKLTRPDHVEELSRQLWLRIWSRNEDITAEDSLNVACSRAGLSRKQADELVGKISLQEIKDELKRSTQEALDLGAFGAPFIVAHVNGKKEVFFGSDRMELLAHILGEKWKGPLVELSKIKSQL